jgi:plastocyanin
MRSTILIPALLLGLVACSTPATDGGSSSEPALSAAPSADVLAVSVADFMIDPSALEVVGPTVTIEVINDGPTPHNLTIRTPEGDVVAGTDDLSAGDTETITADLEPGEYVIFCSLSGHESLGMSGTLTVTAP